MSIQYAKIRNTEMIPFEGNYRNYLDCQGYTKKCGAPTDYMVQLSHSNRWYRVKIWCTSNVGTYFVTVKGNELIVNESDLQIRWF